MLFACNGLLSAVCGSKLSLRRVFIAAPPLYSARDWAMHARREGAVKLTPLSGYMGYALRRAQSVIFADFNHTLRGLNLRPGQVGVLVLIDHNPGPSRSSVSAALAIQKANFLATIADLQARGLGERRKSDFDGRT